MRRTGLPLLCLIVLAACDGSTPLDAGVAPADAAAGLDAGTDAGPASAPDGGATDGGGADAGATDAGATDAGATDAGATDAGGPDAGPIDAGMTTAALVCEALCTRLTECAMAPPDEFAACLSDCGADLVDCSPTELAELERCSTASDACMIDPTTMAPELSLCIASVGCVRG